MRLRILHASAPQWSAAAGHLDELIAGPGFQTVKRTARTVAGFIEVGGARAFVKRVAEDSWIKGWMINFGGARARRVLRGAAMLEAGGFAHPRPLAAVEFVRLGAVRASAVISEELAGAEILSKVAFAGGRRQFRHRVAVSSAVANAVRRLHDAGIYTRDLQETNLLLARSAGAETGSRAAQSATDTAARWTINFVDLEDFRRVRTVSDRRRMLNLVHLDRSIGRFVSRSQRLRFFYFYLGGRPPRAEARRRLHRFMALRERVDDRARRNHRPVGAAAIAPATPHSRAG